MRIAIALILFVFLVFLGAQVWLFNTRDKAISADYAKVSQDLDQAKTDQADLQNDFTYYMNPLNLEKELRARFNYRAAGEHMLIIVPQASSTDQ